MPYLHVGIPPRDDLSSATKMSACDAIPSNDAMLSHDEICSRSDASSCDALPSHVSVPSRDDMSSRGDTSSCDAQAGTSSGALVLLNSLYKSEKRRFKFFFACFRV